MKFINGNTMVEVFKTDVQYADDARMLTDRIHRAFPGYKANFDLEDCDRILRVACTHGDINPARIISLLNHMGVWAEVLADEIDQPHPYNTLYLEN
jgi:hypothetical protein